MKVCKKCKKQVANKAKICKYCGSDVTNSKILKTDKKQTKKTNEKQNKINTVKKPNIPLKACNNYYEHHTFELLKEKQKKPRTRNIKQKVKDLEKTTVLTFKNVLNNTEEEVKKISNKTKKVSNAITPKKPKTKKTIVAITIITFLSIGFILGFNIYKSLSSKEVNPVTAEKATIDKIFKMNDTIDYNGALYKVVKVETSKGNAYKKPKDGNQFLIVSINIKNNTDKKVHYSYANWTMTNSKKEEKKRIFTSINVDTALYSGDLVIGGIKTGSIVFEQPIKDSKLVLNYYELKKDEYGNDVADQAKRVFSINIEVPKEKNKANASVDVEEKKQTKGD